jgi:S-adenosylmethionine:tRNA ribosyltransferase-isomerase
MRTADFEFFLPPELIAQKPTPNRDESRLLHLDRASGQTFHRHFPDLLQFLGSGDVLILNNSRVIPARLRGVNVTTGGQFELLLLNEVSRNEWWAMVRPGKRAQLGTKIGLLNHQKEPTGIVGEVQEINSEGHRRITFTGTENLSNELEVIGEIPLPPYIERLKPGPEDLDRYQTVYAKDAGSVAAPTAGLHFTETILSALKNQGVEIRYITLHVGLGTFAPVKADDISEHIMHEERFLISNETAEAINRAKAEKRRVVAVGTTSVRTLESVAEKNEGRIVAGADKTKIFIFPPHKFKIVDALVTNFHLPCSTLLMLVSAFAAEGEVRGRDVVLSAYAEAIRERYRFFSYGDAMFIA